MVFENSMIDSQVGLKSLATMPQFHQDHFELAELYKDYFQPQ